MTVIQIFGLRRETLLRSPGLSSTPSDSHRMVIEFEFIIQIFVTVVEKPKDENFRTRIA